jgi:hypothetical protein
MAVLLSTLTYCGQGMVTLPSLFIILFDQQINVKNFRVCARTEVEQWPVQLAKENS